MQQILTAFFFLFFVPGIQAQSLVPGQSYYNSNGYAEYIYGTLPIIISAPHGGTLKPATIDDRLTTCGTDIVTVLDTNTEELARAIDSALNKLTGMHPHTIINRLSRQKLDMNRALVEAACGSAIGQQTWYDYHAYIDSAVQQTLRNYGHGIFIDIHGHGHDKQRNEVGYLLTGAQLRLTDSEINQSDYTAISSIRHLAWNNGSAATHAQLVRGAQAFGTLLANAGYPSVPSQQDPYPESTDSYFNGGYNTQRWGSSNGGAIDAFQIETNYTGVRDNITNIRKFADSVAHAIVNYMQLHVTTEPVATPLSSTAFTPGNLLIGRFVTASSTAQKITLLEVDSATHQVVQTVQLPSSGPNAITLGSVVTDGQLALSADSQYVTMAGYFIDSGTTTSVTTSSVGRIVGRVNKNTAFTTYRLPNSGESYEYSDPYNASNIRSAYAADGNTFYVAGGSTSTTNTTTGVWTFTPADMPHAAQVTPVPNTRWVSTFKGNVYMGCQSITGVAQGIYRLGTGYATTSADTIRLFTPKSGSVVSFAFTPDSTTCYVCNNSSSVPVEKWKLNGTTWTYQYTIVPSGITTAPRSMAVSADSTTASIYLVYASQVVRVTDAIAAATASTAAPVVMYTETTSGAALRGVTFTPAVLATVTTPVVDSPRVDTTAATTPTDTITNPVDTLVTVIDSSVMITDTLPAMINRDNAGSIRMFPNPAESSAIVYASHVQAGQQASIQLMQMNGRVAGQVKVKPGATYTAIPIATYPRGVYVVVYINDGRKYSCKMIK